MICFGKVLPKIFGPDSFMGVCATSGAAVCTLPDSPAAFPDPLHGALQGKAATFARLWHSARFTTSTSRRARHPFPKPLRAQQAGPLWASLALCQISASEDPEKNNFKKKCCSKLSEN